MSWRSLRSFLSYRTSMGEWRDRLERRSTLPWGTVAFYWTESRVSLRLDESIQIRYCTTYSCVLPSERLTTRWVMTIRETLEYTSSRRAIVEDVPEAVERGAAEWRRGVEEERTEGTGVNVSENSVEMIMHSFQVQDRIEGRIWKWIQEFSPKFCEK